MKGLELLSLKQWQAAKGPERRFIESGWQLAIIANEEAVARWAYDQLYGAYFERLKRFARKLLRRSDAEDVVQDVFTKLWSTRRTLAKPRDLPSYLFGCVRHRALDVRDREQVEIRTFEKARRLRLVLGVSERQAHTVAWAHPEIEIAWQESLNRLPRRERLAVILYYQYVFHRREIATVLNVSLSTVGNALAHALPILREVFGEFHLGDRPIDPE